MSRPPDVVVIGAGLAGLCCGRRLAQCDVPFVILEASDGVGGRVRTDTCDGFRLDRGFQIYLTAYPEGIRVLDYDALDLKPFTRGALVWVGGRFRRVADPRAEPLTAAGSLVGPVGTARDKLRLAGLYFDARRIDVDSPGGDDGPTVDYLRWAGRLTDRMIDTLFRPFFGGVFLERDLVTSARLFRFLFRTFADGPGAVPAAGMQAIPEQIAAGLPAGSVRLGARVSAVADGGVTLESGETIAARAVVTATDAADASRLMSADVTDAGWRGSTTLYYAASEPPLAEPILCLDGEGTGPVNSAVVLSAAAPAYAPPGRALISASCIGVSPLGDDALDAAARGQLTMWYGPKVRDWRLLRVYRIPRGLPAQPAGTLDPWRRPVTLRPGRYVCGDHRDNASIDGAMSSGFRAAQAVMEDLSAGRC